MEGFVMAQFRGFTCDDCGEVIANGQKQKYIERFEGSVASGERVMDLCAPCQQKRVPEDVTLRSLRRRRSQKQTEAVPA
jgi:hypothetical protein